MTEATLQRRNLIGALLFAPVIIRTPGLLMPVRAFRPRSTVFTARVIISVPGDNYWLEHWAVLPINLPIGWEPYR